MGKIRFRIAQCALLCVAIATFSGAGDPSSRFN